MLFLLLLAIFSVAVSSDTNGIPSLRVVGGRDALSDEYAFVVRIEMLDHFHIKLHTCTGSMITPLWVLTCSHCIQGFDMLWIRYGDMSNFSDKTQTRNVSKLMVHPGYNEGKPFHHNDIGLIMVEENVPVDKLARLSMMEYTSLIGLPVKYAGYGCQKFDEFNLTLPLQVGEGGVIPCDKELSDQDLCVAARCNNSFQYVYKGDSGGPLFYDGRVVGIATAVEAKKALRRVTYQYFTPISPYLDWIQSVIGN